MARHARRAHTLTATRRDWNTEERVRVPTGPFYLFLGATDTESATSRLRAEGAEFHRKLLRSGPENWRQIIHLVQAPALQGVLMALTSSDYGSLLQSRYKGVGSELLDAIAAVPHVVFVHEAVFFSEEERPSSSAQVTDDTDAEVDPYGFMPPAHYFGDISSEVRQNVNEMLAQRDINVVPYRTNAERSTMAAAFLDDHERHLLFRIYVPSGRLYAKEADALLGLFQNWLNETGRNAIRRDGYRTAAGEVYEFFGEQGSNTGELTEQFRQFSDFLGACLQRPAAAAAQLELAGAGPRAANQLVARYAKETRRLQLDLRQAREERILGLKHQFESELLDLPVQGGEVEALLEDLIPQGSPDLHGVLESPSVAAAAVLAGRRKSGGVHLTINQQIVGRLVGNAVQDVQGTVNLSPEAKDLLALIEEYGGGKASDLESAVHELEDTDAPKRDRLAARQKLRRFLSTVATQASGMALTTLHKYLEQRLGIG